MQNLETIVTSQQWDALGDGQATSRAALSDGHAGAKCHESTGDPEKAERLAHRLQV